MVRIRNDIVVLDVRSDHYACLIEGGAWIEPDGSGGLSVADDAVIEELSVAGYLDDTSPLRRGLIAPRRDHPIGPPSSLIDRFGTAARVLAATAAFRGRTLMQLVEPLRAASPTATPLHEMRRARRVASWRACLPWLPFEGECLQRAFQLRALLASDGLAVDWVFGVKTWPFSAHCWLQAGDQVIGDRLERVERYTPLAMF